MNPLLVVDADHPIDWSVIRARGDDAASFLQGQLSCDLTTLASNPTVEGLLLSPAGDVITSLTCRRDDEGVDLVVRRESLTTTLGALRRFLLRTRCTFDVVADPSGPYASAGEQVARGTPGPAEFARAVAAHSFGPDFVASHVSFTKGCFTGQELVGRLDARGGNVPYRLARLTGADEHHLDAVARSRGPQGDRALQGITTAVRHDAITALALVHRTLLESGDTTIEDVQVEVLHGGGATSL